METSSVKEISDNIRKDRNQSYVTALRSDSLIVSLYLLTPIELKTDTDPLLLIFLVSQQLLILVRRDTDEKLRL